MGLGIRIKLLCSQTLNLVEVDISIVEYADLKVVKRAV